MKLHAGTHTVEKSGNFEESKFSIEASSKAFFILSDGLYSNKILAVVRELSTNAYDSHVAANKAHVPFDVHLPTQLDPVFFIRDYGTSMSHEDCMQLYTTYFRSTRNNSNDAVGCLGLGSKAPFAYADSFTVEAFLNGKKRSYTGYKNEDGSPVFSLLDESDTSEADGIKVSINVQSHDVHRFVGEAYNVYRFFNVRPRFLGTPVNYAKPKKVLEGNNWYFDDDDHDNLIIMGQIAYPIDEDQLSEKESQFVRYSSGLRIFVNIGDVDITPSRESLSYSKDTKANIIAKINEITAEITDKIEHEIKNQPTLFKARCKYVQINNQCSSIRLAVESLQKSIMWNDTKLFDVIAVESINVKDKISCKMVSKSGYRRKISTDANVETIHFGDKTKFVVDDLPRGGLGRIKQYIKEEDLERSQFYVYSLNSVESVDDCKFYEILGGATKEDMIFTSSLPKVEYNRTSTSSGDSGPVIQAQVYNDETGHFEPCNMSVKYENAYYFSETKGDITLGYNDTDTYSLQSMLSMAHEHCDDLIGDAKFYLVKPFVIKNRKLEERDNWYDGVDLLTKIVSKLVDDNRDLITHVHSRHQLSNHRNEKWAEVLQKTTTNNRAKQIVLEYNEYSEKLKKVSDNMTTIHNFAKKLPNVEAINFNNTKNDKFANEFDKEMKKYPMLKVINHHIWNESDKNIIAEYIDSIENQTNN